MQQQRTLVVTIAAAFFCMLPFLAFAQPVYWSGNGHYYERVTAPYISWQDAKQAAEARCYEGKRGHLVTITSAQEQAFVWSLIERCGRVPDQFFTGGYEATPGTGNWRWVTDEPMNYMNWAPGEPSSPWYETVIALGLFCTGQWNDVPDDGRWGAAGYIVEYEGTTGDTDSNGCIDNADLLTVLFNFGQTGGGLNADVNCDGVVDDADLLIVLFNFGQGC